MSDLRADRPSKRSSESHVDISHELRTPLNAILGMLELGLDEPVSTVLRDYLTTAHQSALVLLGVLDDLDDLARAQQGRFELAHEPLELREVVGEALAIVQPQAKRRGCSVVANVHADVPERLQGDARRLRQTVENLIEQVLQATEAARIVVDVTVAEKSPAHVELALDVTEDVGSQASSAQRATDVPRGVPPPVDAAAGLHAAMVRQWVGHMNGRMWGNVEDPTGVHCRLRLSPEGKASMAKSQEDLVTRHWESRTGKTLAELTDRPLNVLVADDTPANQKVVKAVLTRRGHHVELADDGREAVALLGQRAFDVVLMDAQMPKMNGLEATSSIRALGDEQAHVPIIGMTAHAMLYDRQRCLAAGMTDYLSKPIDVAALIARVEYYGASPQREVLPTENDREAAPQALGLEGARARLGGDELLLRELIQLFQQDAPSLVEKIQAGLKAADAEAVGRAAHNLRGLAANFDASGTVAAAGEIERLAGDDDFNAIPPQLATLEAQLALLQQTLRHYLARST